MLGHVGAVHVCDAIMKRRFFMRYFLSLRKKQSTVTILVNAYSTLLDPTPLVFDHNLRGQRDRSDVELPDHLNGFIGFIMDSGNREMTPSLYAVMRHLQRVHHHYSFEVEESELDALSTWGWQSNSIFFMTDSTVRDPDGAVLVAPDSGLPEDEAQIPFPADARARKLRSIEQLTSRGIETPDMLPPVLGEDEVVLRAADEVAWRALALFIVAVRAESLATKRTIPVDQLRQKSPMAFESLSPAEHAFMNDPNPAEELVVSMSWRYECLYVLQWALCFHEELSFADNICDVPLVAETMVGRDDRQIINMARLRPVTQLLDALDMNQRMLWMARQAHIDGTDLSSKLEGGVVAERQHALNWLVRFENTDWDEVDTPS